MYHIDSYTYYFEAKTITEDPQQSSINPFIILLSFLQQLMESFPNTIFAVRIANVFFSFLLVAFLYLITRRILNPLASLGVVTMTSFTPIFLTYSIVLHNDIFALAMGFVSVYFSLKPRLTNIIIALIFLSIASLTRFDIYFLFLIPFLINLIRYLTKKLYTIFNSSLLVHYTSIQKISHFRENRSLGTLLIISVCVVIFIVIPFLIGQDYYFSITRFDPIERLSLFLTYDSISMVWTDSVDVTDDDFLNKLFLALLFLSTIFLLSKNYKNILQILKLNYRFRVGDYAMVYVIIIFVISVISNSIFHIGYTIVGDFVLINDRISDRYLLVTQLLLIYGFAFTMLLLVRMLNPSLKTLISSNDFKL